MRTFNPKQLKYEDKSDIKFKHSVFMRNVNRKRLNDVRKSCNPHLLPFLLWILCILKASPHFPCGHYNVYCPDQTTNRVKAATADFDPEVAIRELQAILNWDNKYKSMGAFIGFEVSSVSDKQC